MAAICVTADFALLFNLLSTIAKPRRDGTADAVAAGAMRHPRFKGLTVIAVVAQKRFMFAPAPGGFLTVQSPATGMPRVEFACAPVSADALVMFEEPSESPDPRFPP